jgi:hypothetical protein
LQLLPLLGQLADLLTQLLDLSLLLVQGGSQLVRLAGQPLPADAALAGLARDVAVMAEQEDGGAGDAGVGE